jgi:hypothetical protein
MVGSCYIVCANLKVGRDANVGNVSTHKRRGAGPLALLLVVCRADRVHGVSRVDRVGNLVGLVEKEGVLGEGVPDLVQNASDPCANLVVTALEPRL